MLDTSLMGLDVKVRANDFIQTDLAARITYASEQDRKFLLELAAPITISGVTYSHAVASPRLTDDNLNILLRNRDLGCAVTWVPVERFDQNKPTDLAWWRGGAAAVTDVMLQNT